MKGEHAGWIRKATLPAVLIAALSLALLHQVSLNANDGQSLSPFRHTATFAEGLVLEISGTRRIFRKGSFYEFDLSLSNPAAQAWVDEICVLLLDPSYDLISVLMHDFFTQAARMPLTSWRARLTGRWPNPLDDDTYLLAVIVPDRLATFRPIQIGEIERPSLAPFRVIGSNFTYITSDEVVPYTVEMGRQIPPESWDRIRTCSR